ncbi:MAG: cytochrome C oxidase subunit IV family protein [Chloroflexota bacterium]
MTANAFGVRVYLLTATALLLLTALTIGVAFLPLGAWHAPVALGIAVAKALLIAVIFMHLRYSSPTTRLVAVAGLLWLAILLSGTLDDVVTRGWLAVPGK